MTPRLLPFAVIAALGFVVQLGVMLFLQTVGWTLAVSTVAGVEAAVLHNFAWHERWTWRDRVAGGSRVRRLVAFHAANGLTSIAGNLLIGYLLAAFTGIGMVAATVIAVALTGVLNFMAADRVVFATRTASVGDVGTGRMRYRPLIGSWSWAVGGGSRALMAAGLIVLSGSAAFAAPSPHAVLEWNRFVTRTEARVNDRRHAAPSFDRKLVLAGGMDVRSLADSEASHASGGIADATLQHWRGAVLIPGARLETVLDTLQTTLPAQTDVTAAKVLWRSGPRMGVYLRLVRRAIVTVTYDTEHEVTFQQISPRQAVSRSIMTRVREVRDAGTATERVLPAGDDRGFLWRLNAYWWYEETPAGVIAVVETLTLSRNIPTLLRPVAAPVVRRIAGESVVSALEGLRARFD
jgi:putative flippase GtrA